MVYILGINFADKQLVTKALTSLYGISSHSKNCFTRPPAYRPAKTASSFVNAPSSSPRNPAQQNNNPEHTNSNERNAQATSSSSSSSSSSHPQQHSQDPVQSTTNPQQQQQPLQPHPPLPYEPQALPTQAPSPSRHNLLTRIMARHHIHPTATLGSLSQTTLTDLTASLSELTIENDLRRRVRGDIARLVGMGSYRGRRHVANLPVRGQRTRSQIVTARRLNRVERRG